MRFDFCDPVNKQPPKDHFVLLSSLCLHAVGVPVAAPDKYLTHPLYLLSFTKVVATTYLSPLSVALNGQVCHKETAGKCCRC